MPKLRLIKVIVQPVFVLDDGKNLPEINHPPVAIPADEWPTYSSERFPAEVEAWQRRLDAEAAHENHRKSRPNRRSQKSS